MEQKFEEYDLKISSSQPSAKRPKIISIESGSQLSLNEVQSQPSSSHQADAYEFEMENPHEEEDFLTPGEEFLSQFYTKMFTPVKTGI